MYELTKYQEEATQKICYSHWFWINWRIFLCIDSILIIWISLNWITIFFSNQSLFYLTILLLLNYEFESHLERILVPDDIKFLYVTSIKTCFFAFLFLNFPRICVFTIAKFFFWMTHEFAFIFQIIINFSIRN